MNQETVKALIEASDDDVSFVEKVSEQIVLDKTNDLDELMREIQDNIVNVQSPDDTTIESYLLQLTNALYFLTARCEKFGFYDDISKANVKLKYNDEYTKNQISALSGGKKPTQADNQIAAEIGSVDEQAVNIIYSRSLKIIRGKIDAANEMLRTLSKILSVHMNTVNSTYFTRSKLE